MSLKVLPVFHLQKRQEFSKRGKQMVKVVYIFTIQSDTVPESCRFYHFQRIYLPPDSLLCLEPVISNVGSFGSHLPTLFIKTMIN